MKKLKPVKLTKADTCLTYALKRTGKFKKSLFGSGAYSLENLHSIFDEYTYSELQVGDIVLWSSKMYYQSFPNEITSDGLILSNDVQRNIHVGVIEKIEESGSILFSECSRTKMENGGIPILGMRDLASMRFPDYVLQVKKINKASSAPKLS